MGPSTSPAAQRTRKAPQSKVACNAEARWRPDAAPSGASIVSREWPHGHDELPSGHGFQEPQRRSLIRQSYQHRHELPYLASRNSDHAFSNQAVVFASSSTAQAESVPPQISFPFEHQAVTIGTEGRQVSGPYEGQSRTLYEGTMPSTSRLGGQCERSHWEPSHGTLGESTISAGEYLHPSVGSELFVDSALFSPSGALRPVNPSLSDKISPGDIFSWSTVRHTSQGLMINVSKEASVIGTRGMWFLTWFPSSAQLLIAFPLRRSSNRQSFAMPSNSQAISTRNISTPLDKCLVLKQVTMCLVLCLYVAPMVVIIVCRDSQCFA